jgi:hypothetical protein
MAGGTEFCGLRGKADGELMTSLIAVFALVLACVAFISLKMLGRVRAPLSAIAWTVRDTANAGHLGNTKFSFIAAFLISLASFQSAHAQSSGCSAINSTWGSGISVTNGSELWDNNLTVLAGEKVTYIVTSSGTVNPGTAGFALYKDEGANMADGTSFEQYASPGMELNISGTVTMPADDNRFTLYAWSDPAGGAVQATVTCVGKSDQTITFSNPGTQNFATTPTLTASASSGLSHAFTSATTGVCTITNAGQLTFVTAGICTINVNQAGDASYNSAPQVQQSFTVNAVAPGMPTIGTATAGNGQATVPFTAPASNGGATITGYTVTASPGGATGTGSSGPITVTGLTNGVAYTFTVTATNSGGTGGASVASNSVTPKASQTIVFTNPGAQNFGTIPTLTATADSGLTPDFTSSTTGVCTISGGGTLAFVSAGTCTINVSQSGDASYNAAPQVQQSFTVNAVAPGMPTIGTATAGSGQAIVPFTAPASNGGATITGYTVTASPGGATGTGSSGPITVTGLTNGVAYTFTVTATNSGGTGGASVASNSVTPKASQTIVFTNPGAQNFGTIPTLTATADSGLTPDFTSSTTGVCTISGGGTLAFVSAGTCTISADQAGNGSYLAAATVTQSFSVNGVVPGTPTIGTATAGDGQASISFTAPASNGGAPITGYTVTASPGGATGTGSSGPITVTGLTNGVAYTFDVTATNSAGTGSASAQSNSTTPSASQTITFNTPAAQSFGTTPTLTATADSGLTPTFTSSTTGVCTISGGGALAFVSAGTCTINADQAGNGSYLAAATVTRSFSVNAVLPGMPTIGAASAGDGDATISFTAPTGDGGAVITGYTVTSSPAGITATGPSSPITVTGLTNGIAYTFTVTTTNSAGTGPASAASNSVTPTPALPAPLAGAVSATVPANSTNAAITLNISGGAASSVAVETPAGHGTAAASGTSITYTPIAGYSGTDSFTYTATNATGTSTAATVTITVTAPTFTFSPAAGSLPNGTVNTAYSQTVAAADGASPYTYTLSTGALPAGMTINPSTGLIAGAPTTDGNYNVTITATDTNGATGSVSYSLAIGVQAPLAGAVSATVPANSTNAAITLNISGGAASSVAVETPAGHGTAAASGTSITYTPIAGYSGTDSFTYTATNATGTSTAATVTITVTAPTFTFSPAAGSLPNGTVNTAYSQTVAAVDGASPYTYTLSTGALPAGMTINPSTGVIAGAPTTDGNYNVTITATDTNGATGSVSYSLAIGVQAPLAGAVSATVPANSTNAAITLNISGGAASSVAVETPAGHGTAAASGTSITYTPIAGYSGTDSFTYTATNATGTSTAATVTITVTAPTFTFSPAAGSLPNGTVNTAYSQTVAAVDGASPYTYTLSTGALPAGMTINPSTGVIAGAPTTDGNYSVTITATDTNGATGLVSYTITVKAPVATFTFSPSAGALTEAMSGEQYSQKISATGGTAPLLYSLKSGSLPDGLVLNVSTGELTGPLGAKAETKDYAFTIQVQDGNGAAGTAMYTIKVKDRAVTVPDKEIIVSPGAAPPNVDLTSGATGGPFVSAGIISAEPANAGSVSIVNGEFAQAGPVGPLGWYLKFIPNPAFSGAVRVNFKLTGALGSSNIGTVTYKLGYDGDKVAGEIDDLVHGFVQARQNMISSTIKVPGILERREMANAIDPVTARMSPSEEGMTATFSTSLAQMGSARDSADGISGGYFSPFNVWIDGTLLAHNRDENGGKWGSFAMINLGADYLISQRALVGFSFHYDRMTDPTDGDAELTGNGWLAGPYASFEIGKGVFWDTSLLYGGSANDIDTAFWDGSFDTKRWMIDTAMKGELQLDEVTVLTPKLRAVYFNEKVDDYAVRNGTGDELTIDGFDEEQFRVSLGAEIARSFTLENGSTLTPKLGVTGGYAGLDGSGAYGSVTAGLSLETTDFWMLEASLLLDIEGDGQKSVGGRARASKQF